MPRPHPATKLTPEQVTQIYEAYTQTQTQQAPTPTMQALALLYNVSVSVIHRAIHAEHRKRACQLDNSAQSVAE